MKSRFSRKGHSVESRPDGDRTYCESCGAEAGRGAKYCRLCGGNVVLRRGEAPTLEGPLADASSHMIPLGRVFAITMMTHGLYVFYWFYLTWRQYKAHTGKAPVFVRWGGEVPLLVPIYVLLQCYAHIRRFRELMTRAGVPTTISPWWSLALVIVHLAADLSDFYLSGALRTLMHPGMHYDVVRWQEAISAMLDVLSVFSALWLVLHVQGNLNRYWEKVSAGPMTTYGVNMVEIVLCMLGTFGWIGFLSTLFDLA